MCDLGNTAYVLSNSLISLSRWTPTLIHHTGHLERDVAPLALEMLRKGARVQRAVAQGRAKEVYRGIAR